MSAGRVCWCYVSVIRVVITAVPNILFIFYSAESCVRIWPNNTAKSRPYTNSHSFVIGVGQCIAY